MKRRNSIHSDEIGKILQSKTQIFKGNSNKFPMGNNPLAPPASFASLHSVIQLPSTHCDPPSEMPSLRPC